MSFVEVGVKEGTDRLTNNSFPFSVSTSLSWRSCFLQFTCRFLIQGAATLSLYFSEDSGILDDASKYLLIAL